MSYLWKLLKFILKKFYPHPNFPKIYNDWSIYPNILKAAANAYTHDNLYAFPWFTGFTATANGRVRSLGYLCGSSSILFHEQSITHIPYLYAIFKSYLDTCF